VTSFLIVQIYESEHDIFIASFIIPQPESPNQIHEMIVTWLCLKIGNKPTTWPFNGNKNYDSPKSKKNDSMAHTHTLHCIHQLIALPGCLPG
jgi:hypothetical protein